MENLIHKRFVHVPLSVLVSFCLFSSVFFYGCATVPITGRQQFSIIPSSQLISMSNDSFQELIQDKTLADDEEKKAMVLRVGERVARATEEFLIETGRGDTLRNFDWEFKLLKDDDTVNAFAMPGGKVGVYTGILPVAQNDSGLAAVMAHEVAHVIANHGGERMSHFLMVQLGGITLNAALRKKSDEARYWWMVAYGLGSTVGYVLPYSRLQEREADRIGLILMAKAGYDPRAAVDFWQRMTEQAKNRMPEFLSTHPAPESRIEDIRARIPEALEHYDEAEER
ncbi:MAG: M48 family metallopeptidase [Candidatus Omnitrophota bacterium]